MDRDLRSKKAPTFVMVSPLSSTPFLHHFLTFASPCTPYLVEEVALCGRRASVSQTGQTGGQDRTDRTRQTGQDDR